MSSINEKIKKSRKQKRLTQKEAAEALNVSERMYQRYENDIEPSLESLKILSELFGVNLFLDDPQSTIDHIQIRRNAKEAFLFERAIITEALLRTLLHQIA